MYRFMFYNLGKICKLGDYALNVRIGSLNLPPCNCALNCVCYPNCRCTEKCQCVALECQCDTLECQCYSMCKCPSRCICEVKCNCPVIQNRPVEITVEDILDMYLDYTKINSYFSIGEFLAVINRQISMCENALDLTYKLDDINCFYVYKLIPDTYIINAIICDTPALEDQVKLVNTQVNTVDTQVTLVDIFYVSDAIKSHDLFSLAIKKCLNKYHVDIVAYMNEIYVKYSNLNTLYFTCLTKLYDYNTANLSFTKKIQRSMLITARIRLKY